MIIQIYIFFGSVKKPHCSHKTEKSVVTVYIKYTKEVERKRKKKTKEKV